MALSSNQDRQAAPPDFDCKGGTTTDILLALAKGNIDIKAVVRGELVLPDRTPALCQSAITSAEIAQLSEKFYAAVEGEIMHSLDFFETIQNKLKEAGTSVAKTSSDTLTNRISPLIEQEGALTQRRAVLFEKLETIRREFEEAQTLRSTTPTPESPELKKQFDTLHDSIVDVTSRLDQLRAEQRGLARDLGIEEKTAVHSLSLSEHLKQSLLAQLENRGKTPG